MELNDPLLTKFSFSHWLMAFACERTEDNHFSGRWEAGEDCPGATAVPNGWRAQRAISATEVSPLLRAVRRAALFSIDFTEMADTTPANTA